MSNPMPNVSLDIDTAQGAITNAVVAMTAAVHTLANDKEELAELVAQGEPYAILEALTAIQFSKRLLLIQDMIEAARVEYSVTLTDLYLETHTESE